MKKNDCQKVRSGKKWLLLWLLLFLPFWGLAQSNSITLTWDAQVGCIDYGSEVDPKDPRDNNGVVWEEIGNAQCVRVCEKSRVKYTVSGPNITNVQWNVTGGTVFSQLPQPSTQMTVQWGTAGTGAISITLTYSNGTQETNTICIEKIHGPAPVIGIDGTGEFEVCVNTPINFNNLSSPNGGSDIIHYEWDFGDGSPISNQFEPAHTFTQPGTYTVKLTATNKCNCSVTTEATVVVNQAAPINISCASVVCEGSRETYTANSTCNGEWQVIGGTIVSQNGNTIEVEWDHVDPADGFGYVMYKSECGCPFWTTVKVPVILTKGEIVGEQTICTNKQYTYRLPQWPATMVYWDIDNPGAVQLVYTANRNEIIVNASQPGQYKLKASYINTLLGCKGEAEFIITVDEPLTVQGGSDEVCTGGTQTFTAGAGVPVIWSVIHGGTVQDYPATTAPLVYTFSQPGIYSIYATKPGGCKGEPRLVKAVATPPTPAGTVSGDQLVCLNIPYTYTLSNPDPAYLPVWEVTGGAVQGNNTGPSATVIFTSATGPHTVSVRYRTLDQLACASPAISYNVSVINLNSISALPFTGPYCPSTQHSFGVDLNGIVPDTMEWSFSQSNFGSFVSGQGTANITVNFNEISNNQSSANLILKVVKCGVTRNISFPIQLKTTPVISFANTNNLCLGGDLQFTVDISNLNAAGGQSANVVFDFGNGFTYPAGTVSANGTYTYNIPNGNGYIQNNTGANITQTVIASLTGTAVCNYQPLVSANFIVYPETKLMISPTLNVEICDPANYQPHTLYANASSGLTATTYYTWLQNGSVVAQGINVTSYTVSGPNPYGDYQVIATDINNCQVKSQVIKVIQKCPTTDCTVSPNPNLQVAASWTACNTITASLSYTTTPSQIRWYMNGTLVQNGGTSATLTTDLAGVNSVYVTALYGTCWVSSPMAQVVKNYEPKFNFTQICNTNGTYTLTAHNTSTLFGNVPVQYSFVLNSSGLPAQTGQSATFNNLAPGTYSVKLTLSSPGLPSCSITKQITLTPLPTAGFTYTPGTQVCSGSLIHLQINGYDQNNTYVFEFAGTTLYANGPQTDITINSGGSHLIKLHATTPLGCTYSTTLPFGQINVSEPDFDGALTPGGGINICEGSNAGSIQYSNNNPLDPLPNGYIWMNGNIPVVGAPNSSSFTPTESGNYWPILLNVNDCESNIMAAHAVPVTIRKKPYVNIIGKASLCAGQGTMLYGVTTDNSLNYEWIYNGSVVTNGTGSPAPLNTGILPVGSHVYTLNVSAAGVQGCGSSKNFTVTVSSPPAAPAITYSVEQCQPYTVKLTASGPASGQYNWSNGMSGQTIYVGHGGIYQVTYTAPSGCVVTGQEMVPHSLESLMWIFPTGCYDICPESGYLIGPRGDYNYHEWQHFGTSQQSGSGIIYPYWPSQAGNYQLMMDNGSCQFTSGSMTLNPNPECGVEYDCKLKGHIEYVKAEQSPYEVFGILHNYGSTSITLTISSGNNSGVYYPATITIPAGGTYDFMGNPLLFYPNAGSPGGADVILFTGIECEVKFEVDFPKLEGKPAVYDGSEKAAVSIAPNPARQLTTVTFHTGNKDRRASMLLVHDALGNVKFRKELNAAEGRVSIDTTPWLQGVYIITVVTPDRPLQGKLLKE